MSNPSRSFLLVQERLDADLTETVRQMRRAGDSWHTISLQLHERTSVAVTPETVRLWFVQVDGMTRVPRSKATTAAEAVA